MDLGIQGKRAVVCAASRGLGRAIAQSLAKEGCHLHLIARDQTALAALCRELAGEFGVNACFSAVDLGQPQNLKELVSDINLQTGAIDILINNIGGPKPSAAADTSIEMWRQGFDQLFLSATLMTQNLLPSMRRRGWGRIVTITSISVAEPIDHLAVSTSMRAAVTGFHKTLANEVAADGVTVNTVMPGVIRTDRTVELRRARADRNQTTLAQEIANTEAAIPLRRMGQPDELADIVTFLCSQRASYLTGSNLCVDGGLRRSY